MSPMDQNLSLKNSVAVTIGGKKKKKSKRISIKYFVYCRNYLWFPPGVTFKQIKEGKISRTNSVIVETLLD